MPDGKLMFAVDLPLSLLRTTVVNAETGRLKFLPFDTYLNHVLAKFEPNRIAQNVQNFELFDKKIKVLEPFLAKCGRHFVAETIFNDKVSIFRAISFSVPKIMVVQHV